MAAQKEDRRIRRTKRLLRQALAEIMNEMVMTPAETLEDWMKDSAKRAQIYSGSIIRCTTVEEHIEDLIAAGFITPVE